MHRAECAVPRKKVHRAGEKTPRHVISSVLSVLLMHRDIYNLRAMPHSTEISIHPERYPFSPLMDNKGEKNHRHRRLHHRRRRHCRRSRCRRCRRRRRLILSVR